MLGDYLVLIDYVCDCGRLFGCEKINCVCDCGRLIVCENILLWLQKQSLVQDHHSLLIRLSSLVMRRRRSSQTKNEYMAYKRDDWCKNYNTR